MKLSVITPVRNGEEYILKALNSIPEGDIEIIVVDDQSEDGTHEVVELFKKYSARNIILVKNKERKYCGGSLNVGLDIAQGDYVLQLDSDDYLYTDKFEQLLYENHSEDLIFFINRVNDGSLFDPSQTRGLCDHMCLYKRSLIGETRYGSGKWRMGWDFHNEILSKPHTEYFSPLVCYHYNYPRENSNYDLGMKGLL